MADDAPAEAEAVADTGGAEDIRKNFNFAITVVSVHPPPSFHQSFYLR
jgi:hypothetical protein